MSVTWLHGGSVQFDQGCSEGNYGACRKIAPLGNNFTKHSRQEMRNDWIGLEHMQALLWLTWRGEFDPQTKRPPMLVVRSIDGVFHQLKFGVRQSKYQQRE
ncbi:hypothetical protein BSKO_04808 [Bryopsis sp. KO-2023]|nr:hypothetical protein BSKO_04808 [Bryopsis sp. KO-2023]